MEMIFISSAKYICITLINFEIKSNAETETLRNIALALLENKYDLDLRSTITIQSSISI